MKIFISYARVNKSEVQELAQTLRAHEVWMDNKLDIGQEWWAEIEQQIAACHCFLFVISPRSLESEYCQKELAFAQKLGKPIAPVMLEKAPFPPELGKLQIIDVSEGLTLSAVTRLLNGLFEIERQVFNPLRPTANAAGKTSKLAIADLLFVTTNDYKKLAYEAILGVRMQTSPITITDIQHIDAGEVALHKVKQAYYMLKKPVFVEQAALAVRAWGGFPGGIVTTFIVPVGAANICRMLQPFNDRYAEGIVAIAFTDGELTRRFVSAIPGSISDTPRGKGPSWDTIFVPQGFDQTFAEMSEDQRNSISMRRRAILDFMQFLQMTYEVV